LLKTESSVRYVSICFKYNSSCRFIYRSPVQREVGETAVAWNGGSHLRPVLRLWECGGYSRAPHFISTPFSLMKEEVVSLCLSIYEGKWENNVPYFIATKQLHGDQAQRLPSEEVCISLRLTFEISTTRTDLRTVPVTCILVLTSPLYRNDSLQLQHWGLCRAKCPCSIHKPQQRDHSIILSKLRVRRSRSSTYNYWWPTTYNQQQHVQSLAQYTVHSDYAQPIT
jgi:hypothetical protein